MIIRPLTDAEITLAKTIFGNSIDYAAIKVLDQPTSSLQPSNTSMVVGNNIYMHKNYRDDFAQSSPFSRCLFIHEMTHIWQGQNKLFNQVLAVAELQLKHKFNYAAAYYFNLDGAKDLTDYGLEQQAAIIEEYYLIKHAGMPSYTRHCTNKCSNEVKLKLYEKVLEKFLQNPSYAKQDKLPSFFKPKPPKP
ncbi:MAG: hypothetical protein K8R48_01810 [Alphaproteobacteria bacterium]|nr:hypothetical protein [Alphaproteobacteria bacterium]